MFIIISKKIVIFLTIIVLLCGTTAFFTFADENSDKGVPLIILMYHAVDKSRAGKYIVTQQQLEDDFKYIKYKGYNPITIEQLISRKLPEKAVLLTFDDGDIGTYKYLLPLLEKYNFHAVVNIVGEYSEANLPYYVNWEQVEKMAKSGYIDIGNHTWTLHSLKKRNGILKQKKESKNDYEELVRKDVLLLQYKISEFATCEAFAYPFGAINNDAESIINSLDFKITFGCYEGVNYIKSGPNEPLYRLKRYNRSGKMKNIENILN